MAWQPNQKTGQSSPNMQSSPASSSNGIWSGGRGYIDPKKWQQEYDSVDSGLRASMDYFRLNPGLQNYGWSQDSGRPIYDGLDPQVMASMPTPGAGNRGGVGMPAPQEPGMPAPGTVGAAVQPGGQSAPMSGMVGAAVQPERQSAPMGGNPFAGLPPASGGSPMFGDGMLGTQVQPGRQAAPMSGSPFAGLPPASGGAPMFENDPSRIMYTGGTPNFDETTGQFRTPLPMGAGKFPMTGRLPPDGMATIPGRGRGFGRFGRGGMSKFGPMGGLMGAPDLEQMNLPRPIPRVFQGGTGPSLEAPLDNPFMQGMGDMGTRRQLIRMLMSQF